MAFEASRILFRLGCDVRVYNPDGLPVKDDTSHGHHKVQELRDLSRWSDGHVWVSPEQHGALVRTQANLISFKRADFADWSFQEPDRLDSTLHRVC